MAESGCCDEASPVGLGAGFGGWGQRAGCGLEGEARWWQAWGMPEFGGEGRESRHVAGEQQPQIKGPFCSVDGEGRVHRLLGRWLR